MLRQHDLTVAEGTFRIILTRDLRVTAEIHAPHTMLGPLHVAVDVNRGLPSGGTYYALPPEHMTAGFFDDVGGWLGKAAETTFNAASKVATTLTRPAFDLVKHAAAEGAHLVAQHMPFLPTAARKQLEASSRIILRAKLGDTTAKDFLRGVVSAANAGVAGARAIGDVLLDGSKLVAKAVDLPLLLAKHIPGVGDIVQSLSPLHKFDRMVGMLQKGDFKGLEKMAHDDLAMAQGIVSLVPGVGTGVSAAISAGLAALESGNPLEVAIHAAYGAIPIPLGVRHITDGVLESVLKLAFHGGGNLTDVAVAATRDQIPAGIARDVFDTLINLVVKRMPITKAGAALVDHYVRQYAPAAAGQLGDALKHLGPIADLSKFAQGAFHQGEALAHQMPDFSKLTQHLPAGLAMPDLTKLLPPAAAQVAQEGPKLLRPLHLLPSHA